jgi:hypothetical protein
MVPVKGIKTTSINPYIFGVIAKTVYTKPKAGK